MQKVSIIVPIYNAAKFLRQSIVSLLQQTYPNIEIIVVDDSSTDDSYFIAKSFEEIGIKVFQQKNSGAAVARNTGLAHATGDYIQFMDADDLLSPDKIEKQVEALEGNPGKIAVCNYVQFENEEELVNKIPTKDQSGFIYSSDNPAQFLINLWGGFGGSNFIQTNSWLVPRNIAEKVGGWRKYKSVDDDGEFFTRVLLASEGIVYVPGICNYYRKASNAGSLSGSIQHKYLQNALLTIDLKYQYLYQYRHLPGFNRAFATQYFEYAVYNYPRNRILSRIAEKRFSQFGVKVPTPMLGGNVFMMLNKLFGWKTVRLLRYYLKERD